jgi:phosphatidylinositol alpha-1,6-mannosyltransferase
VNDLILLTEHFPPSVGGSAVLFDGVYSRLPDCGVLVLTDDRGAGPSSDRRGAMQICRRPIATRRWGMLQPAGFRHHVRVASVLRTLGAGRDAIVHCGRALPEGVAAWVARRLGGPRYVCWAHGEDLATARTSRELSFLTRRVFRGAAAAIANSRHTAAMLSAIGIASDRIHVVYPGVDAERFHPHVDGTAVRRFLSEPGDVVLLSVGRLQRRKGHDLVLGAMAALRDRLPTLRYVIVGDGEERQRLERLAASYGVDSRVYFAGEVPSALLPAYYAACDMFVLPNRIEGDDLEGFGIVFLEAAATGKPAIGGRSGGVPEAIAEGQTGLLVGGTDAGELAAAIVTLARSPHMRARLGRAARARIVAEFSWQRAATVVNTLHHRLTTNGCELQCSG